MSLGNIPHSPELAEKKSHSTSVLPRSTMHTILMQTILGAGGAIGNPLARELLRRGEQVRLVSRNPKKIDGVKETVAANVSDADQVNRAVAGSNVVYLVVGLRYDLKVWQALWPGIMRNTIEACKRAGAKLVFFDNVYMYGRVSGPMTEQTPFNPCSKKGEIRARIAMALLDEVKAGNLKAMIARAADFYGPDTRTGIPNVLVFDKFATGAKASWLINDSVPHSFTYTPDAAKGLVMLAERETSWNQTWHLPTASHPLNGNQLIQLSAKEFGVSPKYRILSGMLLKLGGWFDPAVRELNEMLYQYDSEYLFDSTKFQNQFGFQPTPYPEGIRAVVESYKHPPQK